MKTLEEIPKRIARMTRGCTARQLHEAPESGAWSARDVVAHLRACADVWGKSVHRMLTEDHPAIRYVSPRSWMKKPQYQRPDFDETLRLFREERATFVGTLSKLKRQEWSRGASFTATTLGREGTVLSYAARIASHEVHHLDQIARTLKALEQTARSRS